MYWDSCHDDTHFYMSFSVFFQTYTSTFGKAFVHKGFKAGTCLTNMYLSYTLTCTSSSFLQNIFNKVHDGYMLGICSSNIYPIPNPLYKGFSEGQGICWPFATPISPQRRPSRKSAQPSTISSSTSRASAKPNTWSTGSSRNKKSWVTIQT